MQLQQNSVLANLQASGGAHHKTSVSFYLMFLLGLEFYCMILKKFRVNGA